jgi:hypothetical protein
MGCLTQDLDLMVTFPPHVVPQGIEFKVGDAPTFTQPQAYIYPQIMVGHSYSPDPQIGLFGFEVGAPLPPIGIDLYYTPGPGQPLSFGPLGPEFVR